jgi:ATP adenylyltransferase
VPWQQGFSFVSATPWHTRQDSPIPPTPSATYGRLRHSIAKRMRMSPIDQPLMPMELLGRRSPAPARDVAHRILGSAWWAGFTFNGITAYGDGQNSLIGGDALLELCRQRLDAFREQPDQRLSELQGSPMRPGPLRVLRRSRASAGPGGGPHHPQKPGRLRRHQQPAGPLLPLQRRQARRLFAYARGRTDFRGVQASYGHREAGCVFCVLEGSGRVLLENEGHSLVIPRRHGADGLELHQPEWNAVVELLKLRREQLSAQNATISGSAGWFAQRQRGAELRRGGGAVGVSCALASDSEANR